MDYLDLKKAFRQHIVLFVGYGLIAVAITMTAIIILHQAYGYGLNRNGAVIQSGLVYFSSQPRSASIYVNGKLESNKTNTRLLLPGNIYKISLSRNGYRDWQRTINLDGGSVEHFDYPLLIPKQVTAKKFQTTYASAPGLSTQSPDRRWLLVQQPNTMTAFDLYDLKNPISPVVNLTLPSNLLTTATGAESWQFVEWADDNQHILLQHIYDNTSEYVLLDRDAIDQSVNLNTKLSATPSKLTLNNKKYDQYYLYDKTTQALETASKKQPTLLPHLQHVLAYKSYSDTVVLYVTDSGAPAGKVLVKMLVGDTVTTLRSLPTSPDYVLDLTKYSGTSYVVLGATNDSRVFIYRDPLGQLAADPKQAIVPTQVLHVDHPDYVSFSNNAQFIMAESGTRFGVYDIENKLGYNYTATPPIDAPQTHATWMDGDRLAFVSNGKTTIIDYDNANHQTLTANSPAYLPVFSPDFKYLYGLAPTSSDGQFELTQTALITSADL